MAKKKKEKAPPQFKRYFYVQFNFEHWLGDLDVQSCSHAAQGFWMNLLGIMIKCYPYGHLSRFSPEQVSASNDAEAKRVLGYSPDNPPLNAEDKAGAMAGGAFDDDFWVNFHLNLSPQKQLLFVKSWENNVHILIPNCTKEQAKTYLAELETNNVFSRNEAGIIFSRRLVRDFKQRIINFQNGLLGGNPLLTKKKSKKPASSPGAAAVKNLVSTPDNPPVIPPDNPPLNGMDNGADKAYINVTLTSNSNSTNGSKNVPSMPVGGIERGAGERKGAEGAGTSDTYGATVPEVTYEDLEAFGAQMQQHKTFWDGILYQYPIADTAADWIKLFNHHCITEGKMRKNQHEYQKHFRNWIALKPTLKPPPKAALQRATEKRTNYSSETAKRYQT